MMMPGCIRSQSSNIAASRTVVSMLWSSRVWTPKVKMMGFESRLREVTAVEVEGRGLVGFSHVTGPFRMKVETALNSGFLRFCSFEAAVTRIDIALENDFGVGQGHCIDGASFDQTHRRALDCAGDADFIATLRQD